MDHRVWVADHNGPVTTELASCHRRHPWEKMLNRRTVVAAIAVPVLVAVGVGVGEVMTHDRGAAAGLGVPAQPGTVAGSGRGSTYDYYRTMMIRLDAGQSAARPGGTSNGSMMGGSSSPGNGSMMGGLSYASMMGGSGYTWMMGGATAPGWMRGGTLPTFLMGSGGDAGSDPGDVMGRLFANSPGPRVSPAEATRLGGQVPAGSAVDAARNRLTVTGHSVHLVALTSPVGGRDDTFRIAGLVNPTITVSAGARVSIEVINADPGTSHGLAISASGAGSDQMPMMTAGSAFPGSAVWFLGDPTTAGMHAGTLTFSATTPGRYQYLCPSPNHARKGMVGTFIITP